MPSFVDTLLAGRHAPDDEIRQRRDRFTLAILALLDEYAGHPIPPTLIVNACAAYGLGPVQGERLLAELVESGLLCHRAQGLAITLRGQTRCQSLGARYAASGDAKQTI